jgi:hypothetical protein
MKQDYDELSPYYKQALNSHATIQCQVKILKLVRSQSYHVL